MEPCVTCRKYRPCVSSSGSGKAASGQSTHIKWADSIADEPQALRPVHSSLFISEDFNGLMEHTQQRSHRSSPSLVQMQNVGDSRVSKWTPEPTRSSPLSPPPPPLDRPPPLIIEDKLSFSTSTFSLTPDIVSVSLFSVVRFSFFLHKVADVTTLTPQVYWQSQGGYT